MVAMVAPSESEEVKHVAWAPQMLAELCPSSAVSQLLALVEQCAFEVELVLQLPVVLFLYPPQILVLEVSVGA
jgi:hypothetical protein